MPGKKRQKRTEEEKKGGEAGEGNIQLGLLSDALVETGGIEDVAHAVVEGVDNVDARVAGRGVVFAAGAAGGGADI